MTKDKLIEDNIGLVYHIVDRYFKNSFYYISREDLVGEGLVALVESVNSFDENKGSKFSTYAYHCVKNHLINYVSKDISKRNQTDSIEVIENLGTHYDTYNFNTKDEVIELLRDNIPEKPANMIIDYYFNEMTWQEIANKYGYDNYKCCCSIASRYIKKIRDNETLKNKFFELIF